MKGETRFGERQRAILAENSLFFSDLRDCTRQARILYTLWSGWNVVLCNFYTTLSVSKAARAQVIAANT
jgi:hypothetical protein